MSEKQNQSSRRSKDPALTQAERRHNKEVSGRLIEKYNEWSEGKPKAETKREALADAIQKDLGITIEPETVKKYLRANKQGEPVNNEAVSGVLLKWFAEKFETSVNYLLTGNEYAPKAAKSEGASAPEVLDALLTILDAFDGSIEFSSYEKEVTICVAGEDVLDSFPQSFLALHINSEEIQMHLANWKHMKETINRKPQARDVLREKLFVDDFREARKSFDSVSKSGVFYNAEEEPAFIKPLSRDAVPVAVPKEQMHLFANKFVRWEPAVFEGIPVVRAIKEYNPLQQKAFFAEDSKWNKKDVYKYESENTPPSPAELMKEAEAMVKETESKV